MTVPLTIETTDRLKNIVLNYLQGESISVTKVSLEAACADMQVGCKELYKSISLLQDKQEDQFITAILGSMNIKKGQLSGTYEKLMQSNSLHEMLTHLYHDGHHQVGYLLTMIENTKPRSNWAPFLILGTALSALTGGFLYYRHEYIDSFFNWVERTFPTVMEWLGRTFSLVRNIPIVGIIYNSLGLAWHWYGTFSNGTTSNSHKLESLLFKTLTVGLTIAAYTLTYFADGILPLPAAILFVIGASIDTFKSVFFFYRTQNALLTLTPPNPDESNWEKFAEYERATNLHYCSMQTVGVKLGAAVLTTVAVGIWNFFPPNLVLTIACMSVISLVALTKRTIITNIQENYAHRLQRIIRSIEGTTSLSPELRPSNHSSINKLHERQTVLDRKEETLKARESDLEKRERELLIRKQAIADVLLAMEKGQSSPSKVLLGLSTPERRVRRRLFKSDEPLTPIPYQTEEEEPETAHSRDSAHSSAEKSTDRLNVEYIDPLNDDSFPEDDKRADGVKTYNTI